ncbi:MAG: [FeFe] hydrogenase, group A [Synergistaceae bacterium]|jgi:NADH-quinone oxidoreductase subunit G|nr:[FeFe] hydrogenase, group A [Synergistaceae bacterium]
MKGNGEYMTIDGIPVAIEGEKNILEIVRKIGIKMPTFCYHTELSIYGACRMCVVENQWNGIDAACSAAPRPGLEIRTNTERLRKYRKMILELLLTNHCRDCTACGNSTRCKLQDLATRFNIDGLRFPNTAAEPNIDDSSLCVTRDRSKCILCGDCVRMCNEIQNVGAIDFAGRGSKMSVSSSFGVPMAESPCVGCGQCAAVCPTGAIVVKNDIERVWKALDDKETKTTVQIAPAVRVALGEEFGLRGGENSIGAIVAALRRMGFDEIYDTAAGADLTVLEESNELLKRLESGENDMPLFTSCCPAWVNYCEKFHPDLMPHVSTCRSPMQMLAAVIHEQNRASRRKSVHVAVMPCTAKKFESAREEFRSDEGRYVDYVITTQELIRMIRESGIAFLELEPEAVDTPFGTVSGAGVIFGVTGGVTEAVLRRVSSDKTPTALMSLKYKGIRGAEGIKTATVKYGDRELKTAVTSGLGNASLLIDRINKGERYDFVEVMACPGGCVCGAGQPFAHGGEMAKRGDGLYSADRMCGIKRSEENPLMVSLYSGLLKGKVHDLLHVNYSERAGAISHD